MIKRDNRDTLDCTVDPEFLSDRQRPLPRGLAVTTLTQGKAENSINTDQDMKKEDEDAQDDYTIAKELERGTLRLTACVVFRVRRRAAVFPDRSLY